MERGAASQVPSLFLVFQVLEAYINIYF